MVLAGLVVQHVSVLNKYPGDRVWGRGAADDKNGLIGILYVAPRDQ